MNTVKIVEQKKETKPDGTIIHITKLSCGCSIIYVINFLNQIHHQIPEPTWFRCSNHRKAKPEEIIIEREE